MKKLFALILVLSMVLSMVPAFAAGECTCTDDTAYTPTPSPSKPGKHYFKCDICDGWKYDSDGEADGVCDAAEANKDSNYHWNECSECGRVDESTKAAHTFSWRLGGSYGHYGECACGYGVSHTPDYVLQADGTTKKCSVCKLTETVAECAHLNTTLYIGTPATCDAAGTTDGEYCNDCKAWVTVQETIKKLEHDLDEVVTLEPTCYKPGTKVVSCKLCDYEAEVKIPVTEAHDLVFVKTISKPDCYNKGQDEYKCTICKEPVYKDVDKLVHNTNKLVVVDDTQEKNPDGKMVNSCKDGVYTYYACDNLLADGVTVCGHQGTKKTFTDSSTNGSHDWTAWTEIEGTCTKPAGKYRECVNEYCDVYEFEGTGSFTGKHGKIEKVTIEEATCTTKGSVYYYCTVCGAQTDADGKDSDKTFEVAALGHTNEITPLKKTSYADQKDKEGVIVWKYTAPTCTEYGFWVSDCSVCNDNYKMVVAEAKPPVKHSYTEREAVSEEVCEKNADYRKICEWCGAVEKNADGSDKLISEKVDHKWELDGVPFKAPTCSAEGEGWEKCARCGEVRYNEHIEKLDSCEYEFKYIEADCDTDAKSGYFCIYCDTPKGAVTTYTGTALGHATVKVTTEFCGYGTVIKEYCTREDCDYVKYTTVTGATILHPDNPKVDGMAKDHTYKEKVLVEATCTTDGKKETHVCEDCGYIWSASDVVVIKRGHQKPDNAKEIKTTEANCVEPGMTTYVCKICGETIVEIDTTKPVIKTPNNETGTGHKDWDIVEWVDEASCTESGFGYYGCKYCGKKAAVAEKVPADHKWAKDLVVVVAPTCDEDGKGYKVCTVCGAINNTLESIDKTGKHVYGEVRKEAKVCTQNGYINWECVVCGKRDTEGEKKETVKYLNSKTNAIATLPKGVCNYGPSVLKKEADCQSPAGYFSTCSVCGNVRTDAILPGSVKLPHDPVTTTVEDTCFKAGYTQTVCFRCGEVISEKEGKLLPHKLVANKELSEAATCTTVGYTIWECSECDYAAKEPNAGVNPLNHVWTTVIPVREMDCATEQAGLAIQKCAYCNIKEKANILPVEHKYETEIVTPATCTSQGIGKQTCSVCGKVNPKAVTIDRLEHSFVTKTVEADCDHDAGISTQCSVCGLEKSFVKTGAGKMEHLMGDAVLVEATCDLPGGYKTSCQREGCDYFVFKQEPAKYPKHEQKDWTKVGGEVKGTCVEDAYQLYHCDKCDLDHKVYKNNKNGKGDGVSHKKYVTKTYINATCTQPGVVDLACELCNWTDSKVSTKIDHVESNYIVADNAVYKICLVCGEITETLWIGDNFVNYTGCTVVAGDKLVGAHKGLVVNATKDATCTEDGELGHIECTACGTVLQQGGVIPAHKTEVIPAVDPKCGVKGWTEGLYCTVCKKNVVEPKEIAALEHKFVKVPAKAPTATETGLTEGEQCELCGEWKIAQEVLPVKGAKLLRTAVIRETAELLGTRVAIAPATTAITITGVEVNGFYPVATELGNGFIHNSYIEVA